MPASANSLPESLPALWAEAYKRAPRLGPLVLGDDETGPLAWSYQHTHALVHCLEAYLMACGLEPGQAVLVVAQNHPVCVAYDLALLHLGALQVALPPDAPPELLQHCLATHQPRLVLLSHYSAYARRRSLWDALPHGTTLVCHTTRHDDLTPNDRLVTLDAAVDNGKEFWRLNQRHVHQRLRQLHPNRPALHAMWPGNTWQTATQAELLLYVEAMLHLVPALGPNMGLHVLAPPHLLLHRVAGLYTALLQQQPLFFSRWPAGAASGMGAAHNGHAPSGPQSFVCVTPPAELNRQVEKALHEHTRERPTRQRRLEAALNTVERVWALRSKRQPVGFVLKQRFGRARRYLRRIYRAAFPGTAAWLTQDLALISRPARLLLHSQNIPVLDVLNPAANVEAGPKRS